MNTAPTLPTYRWKDIPWKQIQRNVFKLQKRIYQASKDGNVKQVRTLQRLLMKSKAGCLLAVRKVTQENRGKKTAGVDGIKSLTLEQRMLLAQELMMQPFSGKVCPVRRVWIPKPGKHEMRPLGIPTMEDRARQALAKLALEPEWEAKFEPHSFGFRPGRSAHDAINNIFLSIKETPTYVLDADIAKCYDRINHEALLKKLNTFPRMRRTIKHWLKAGIMDSGKLFPSEEGTPQGGVASPLLANIALHGLESAVQNAFPAVKTVYETAGNQKRGRRIKWRPTVIRYADDFVILHRDLEVIQKAKAVAAAWLKEVGLELSEKKTRITHTLEPGMAKAGFDFLGFHVRQYPLGKTHIRKTRTKTRHFLTLVQPSKTAMAAHTKNLSQTIRSMRACPQEELIARLNPQISGWANYHAIGLYKSRVRMDNILFTQLRRWAYRRHCRKSRTWIVHKYWRLETGKWRFGTPDGSAALATHARKVLRQYPVRRRASIFDGDWMYWATRMGRHPNLSPIRAKLLKQQRGKCASCGLYFRIDDDIIELDHVVPTSRGGVKQLHNLQLLHAHCHDSKTALERAVGIHVKD